MTEGRALRAPPERYNRSLRMLAGSVRRWMPGLLGLPLALSGCLDPTQAKISITTDADCPLGGTTLTFGSGNIESKDPTTSTPACQDDGRIGSIVATPSEEKDADWSFRVVTSIDPEFPAELCVAPEWGPSCIVARRSLGFLPNKSLYLPVAMRVSCAGVKCPDDRTCVEGYCKPARVNPDDCTRPEGCTPAAGAIPWVVAFGGDGTETVTSLLSDSEDILYLTGTYDGEIDFGAGLLPSFGAGDVFVTSLSPGGHHRWSRGLGSASLDQAGGIALGPGGLLYLLVTFQGGLELESGVLTSEGGSDLAVIALSPTGQIAWARAYGGSGDVLPGGIAVTPDGRIAVSGSFTGSLTFGETSLASNGLHDVFLATLDAAGEPSWAVAFGGAEEDFCAGVAVDGSAFYLTGRTEGGFELAGKMLTTFGQQDGLVASFDERGSPRWAMLVGGRANDAAIDVAVRGGAVAVIGNLAGRAEIAGRTLESVDADAFVALLDAAGEVIWARTVGASGPDSGSRVTFAPDGGLIAAGAVFDAVSPADKLDWSELGAQNPFMLRLDREGRPAWSEILPALAFGSAGGVAAASNGDVFVAGGFATTLASRHGELLSSGRNDIFVARIEAP
jgi:hypothetical protein